MPTIQQKIVPSVALNYAFVSTDLPADPGCHPELIADFDAGRIVGWDLTITSHEVRDGEIVTSSEHLGQVLVPSDRDPCLADVADYLPDMLSALIVAPGIGRKIAEQTLADLAARYFVINGHTLGYRLSTPDLSGGFRWFGVLRALYNRGGPIESQAATDEMIISRDFRPATPADFEEFRVSMPADMK